MKTAVDPLAENTADSLVENTIGPPIAAPLMTFAELRLAAGAAFFGSNRGEVGNGGGNGERHGERSIEQRGFTAVCIDSRAAKKGSLFAALAGASQDGHRFVEAAFA